MADLILRFRVMNDGQAKSALRGVKSAALEAGRAMDEAGRGGRRSAQQMGQAWNSAGRPLRATEKLAAQVARDQQRAAKKAADVQVREAYRVAREKQRIASQAAQRHERSLRQQARLEQRLGHARERREASFAARISRVREAQRYDLLGATTRGVAGVGSRLVGGAIRFGGLAAAGVAGLTGAALRESVTLSDSARKLARKGGPGFTGEGLLSDAEKVAGQVRGSKVSGILGAQDAFVTKTGDLEAAQRFSKVFAEISLATGTAADEIGGAAADLFQKFDISSIEDMEQALASLAVQGKRGAFELEDAARLFPRILASARRFGVEGNAQGLASIGGFTQIARQSTGSGEEAATAVENAFSQLIKKSGVIEKLGVDVFTDKSKTQGRDFRDVITETIAAAGGNQQTLADIFGIRGIRAVSPLISTFTEARASATGTEEDRTAAGLKAMREQLAQATDASGALAEIQADLASAQQDASSQLSSAWERFRAQVGAELLPVLSKFVGQLAETDFTPLIDAIGLTADAFLGLLKTLGLVDDRRTRGSEYRLDAVDADQAATNARQEAAIIRTNASLRGGDLTPAERARVTELDAIAADKSTQVSSLRAQQASAEQFSAVPINEADQRAREIERDRGASIAQAGGIQSAVNNIAGGITGVEGLSAADRAAADAARKITGMAAALDAIRGAADELAGQLREAGGAARAFKEAEGS